VLPFDTGEKSKGEGVMAGQMEEIDRRLKGIERRIGYIEFSLSPGNSPSIFGLIEGLLSRTQEIANRLQRIEEKLGISN
jgi:tetrahydromethanopterin S-methyltransferase subunit G